MFRLSSSAIIKWGMDKQKKLKGSGLSLQRLGMKLLWNNNNNNNVIIIVITIKWNNKKLEIDIYIYTYVLILDFYAKSTVSC